MSFIVIAFLFLAGCGKEAQLPYNKLDKTDSTALKIERLNVLLHDNEDSLLALYADSLRLDATRWGVYVKVYHVGSGDSVAEGDAVRMDCRLYDLDGNVLLEKAGDDAETTLVGKDRHQKGLSYALQMMRRGDSATVLVPSVMAYGALGDRKNIPPRASLLYKISNLR